MQVMASKSKNGIEAANGKFRFVFRNNGDKVDASAMPRLSSLFACRDTEVSRVMHEDTLFS